MKRIRLLFLILLGAGAPNAFSQPPAPAPVPKSVAIERPTEEEVQKARRSLEDFFKKADSKTKALHKKHPDLISVKVPPPNSAIVPNLAPWFQKKHESNLEEAKKGDIELLFMGDSITDMWRDRGKPVFDRYYGSWKTANFGIGGDTTQGVLYRLQHGEGRGFSPRAIMLMIGTNNIGNNTAPEIAEAIGAIVMEMQKGFPKAKILLLGIFPRGDIKDAARTIAEINGIIAKLHDGDRVHYLDIGAKFLDEKGGIPKEVMSDLLHPTLKGYEIWAEAVQEPLAALLK